MGHNINAQGEEEVPNYLFLFGQIDVSSQTTISYTLTSQETYWEIDTQNEYFPISTESDLEEASVSITGSTTSKPSYTGSTAWKGYVFLWTTSPYPNTDDIAYGIYKVTNSYNNHYFYIDIRDCKYNQTSGFVPNGYLPDFYLRFNDDQDIFQWRRTHNTGSWTTISTGEILNVWNICNNGTAPTTSYFEDFWENALVATNNGSDHPRVVWGPYPNPGSLPGTITGYKVYRSANHVPGQTPSNFTVLTTINDPEVFEYVDNSITMGSDLNARSYYVKAVYEDEQESSGESSATNTVEVRLQIPQKLLTQTEILPNGFNISQNYPNPFNPTTKITYALPEDSKVMIKIYDILGTEITGLVNEYKTAGVYETTFDASELSSGVYVYRIAALNGDRVLFSETKQMMLVK